MMNITGEIDAISSSLQVVVEKRPLQIEKFHGCRRSLVRFRYPSAHYRRFGCRQDEPIRSIPMIEISEEFFLPEIKRTCLGIYSPKPPIVRQVQCCVSRCLYALETR